MPSPPSFSAPGEGRDRVQGLDCDPDTRAIKELEEPARTIMAVPVKARSSVKGAARDLGGRCGVLFRRVRGSSCR